MQHQIPTHLDVTITTQHQIPSPPHLDITITTQCQSPPISMSPSTGNVRFSPLPIPMSPSFLGITKLVTKSLAQRPSYHSNNDKPPFPWHVNPRLSYFSCPVTTLVVSNICTKRTLPMKTDAKVVTDNINICSGTISNVTILNV